MPGFDYDKFFRAYAYQYAATGSRMGFKNYCYPDEHPTGRCRVNKVFSLVDEFYTTYDIKEGDAMYVAPENRPYIW
jgi:putative endopeptidase